MNTETKNLVNIGRGLAEAMLSNPVIMDPHLQNNPDDDEIVTRSIRMAEQLIKEAEEKVRA